MFDGDKEEASDGAVGQVKNAGGVGKPESTNNGFLLRSSSAKSDLSLSIGFFLLHGGDNVPK